MNRRHYGHGIALIGLGLLMHDAAAQLRVDRSLSITPPNTNNNGTSSSTSAIDKLSATAAKGTPANSGTSQAAARPAGAARTSGSYVAETMGASIVAKNANYATHFKINITVPPGSTITQVAWRYGLSMKPVGFEAVLCWDEQQPCWNVTNENSGSTSAFNGKDASRPFTLFYRVQGSGPLGPPAQGKMDQIVVSYDRP